MTYEVYAIKYATLARTAAENFIGGDPHEAGMPLDYYVWLARNAARTVVIDTGFNESAGRRRKRLIDDVPTSKVAGVFAGLNEVKGTSRCDARSRTRGTVIGSFWSAR